MTLNIFHTADIHLGLKFSSYPEDLAKKLSEARFQTLERMIQTANEEHCHLFVVAGDLFDHPRIPQKQIIRAAKIFSQFSGVVLILPGNHDYITQQEDDLWKIFQSTRQDRILILGERRPYSLRPFDLDVSIYPAPCQNKHSKKHGLDWLKNTPREQTLFQIGVAHGSFEGLTPDIEGDYYPMKREDLLHLGMDLWLMGHIHVQFPPHPGTADRIFYPATPEPDGFDCRHEGKAWILELSAESPTQKQIIPHSRSTGHFRFNHQTAVIRTVEEMRQFVDLFSSPLCAKTLLKLNIVSSLPREDYLEFMNCLEELKNSFFHLILDTSQVRLQLNPQEIDREFSQGSFPHLLLSALTDRETDREALQIAYELIKQSQNTQQKSLRSP